MQRILSFLLLTFLALGIQHIWAEPPASFPQAKKLALNIFKQYPVTLYCQCRFDTKKKVDLSSCNMSQAEPIKRAHRIEWEHMMPAENFGRHFPCWREKLCTDKRGRAYRGRKCCEKISPEFRKAEAELFNLWPAVGVINQMRSNYRYSPLEGSHNTYGCNFISDKKLRKAEPADISKGVVARANLFMSDKYQINLSKSQRKIYEAWHQQFPPNAWEQAWAMAVAAIEGYENPYITGKA